jgi:hypothetical protein
MQHNTQRWTQDEELELIKLIKSNASIEDIARKHNRDVNSIDLRLQKIIYENITRNGKDVKSISLALNIPYNDVIKKYKLYKEREEREERGERGEKEEKEEEKKNNIPNIENAENVENIDQKIEKLERENKLIKLILENKILHKKLNEQIKKDRINKNILDVIKDMRK